MSTASLASLESVKSVESVTLQKAVTALSVITKQHTPQMPANATKLKLPGPNTGRGIGRAKGPHVTAVDVPLCSVLEGSTVGSMWYVGEMSMKGGLVKTWKMFSFEDVSDEGMTVEGLQSLAWFFVEKARKDRGDSEEVQAFWKTPEEDRRLLLDLIEQNNGELPSVVRCREKFSKIRQTRKIRGQRLDGRKRPDEKSSSGASSGDSCDDIKTTRSVKKSNDKTNDKKSKKSENDKLSKTNSYVPTTKNGRTLRPPTSELVSGALSGARLSEKLSSENGALSPQNSPTLPKVAGKIGKIANASKNASSKLTAEEKVAALRNMVFTVETSRKRSPSKRHREKSVSSPTDYSLSNGLSNGGNVGVQLDSNGKPVVGSNEHYFSSADMRAHGVTADDLEVAGYSNVRRLGCGGVIAVVC